MKIAFHTLGCKVNQYETEAMAKLFRGQMACDISRRCCHLYGGYGFIRDYPVERFMRDAKIIEVYEGTNEAQRMVISASLGIK